MESHQVRYFTALADLLNFTRAAEHCNVTQPALTRAIRQLEVELGGPLFHRERNNTHLTELGRTMRPYLEAIQANMREAREKAQGMARLESAQLDLGLMCTIGPTKLVDLIGAFRARHPEVEIRLRDGTGSALEAALIAGELDVAMLAKPEPLDQRLHATPLFTESFMITFARGHPFAAMNQVVGAALDGQSYICRANCEFNDHAARLLGERGIEVQTRYSSEREDWVMAMILAGLGVGFTPACAITLPGVEARLLVDPAIERTVHVATVRGRPHSPAVGAFLREAMAWRARGCPAAGESPLRTAI